MSKSIRSVLAAQLINKCYKLYPEYLSYYLVVFFFIKEIIIYLILLLLLFCVAKQNYVT